MQKDEGAGEVAAYFYGFRSCVSFISAEDIQFRPLALDKDPNRVIRQWLRFSEPLLVIPSKINRALKYRRPK